MARAYEIFATREDLLELLDSVEALRSIQYVRAGLFSCSSPVAANSARNIEHLGIASSGDQNHEPIFLALNSDSPVNVRLVPQRCGGVKYAVDQIKNPESVVIKTGGEYGSEALISSQIGTATNYTDSLSLIHVFA